MPRPAFLTYFTAVSALLVSTGCGVSSRNVAVDPGGTPDAASGAAGSTGGAGSSGRGGSAGTGGTGNGGVAGHGGADAGSGVAGADASAGGSGGSGDDAGPRGDAGGVCVPGVKSCSADNQQTRTCGADGHWGAGITCSGTCIGSGFCVECVPNTTECLSDTTYRTCRENGYWNPRGTCTNACVDNACGGECVPRSNRCAPGSVIDIQTCGINGQWGASISCGDRACVSNACTGVCKPRTKRCETNVRSQICGDNGQWAGVTQCSACAGAGACGRIVFTTSVTYTGFLGETNAPGINGADAKCQALAEQAGLPGEYRAWLSDGLVAAKDRINDGGPFMLVDGTVVAQNKADLMDGTLAHAIDKTESGGSPPEAGTCTRGVWTNTRSDGTAVSTENTKTCSSWNYAYPELSAQTGAWDRADGAWTNQPCPAVPADPPISTCNFSFPLYCVQYF
jgi:hypothetical protein